MLEYIASVSRTSRQVNATLYRSVTVTNSPLIFLFLLKFCTTNTKDVASEDNFCKKPTESRPSQALQNVQRLNGLDRSKGENNVAAKVSAASSRQAAVSDRNRKMGIVMGKQVSKDIEQSNKIADRSVQQKAQAAIEKKDCELQAPLAVASPSKKFRSSAC